MRQHMCCSRFLVQLKQTVLAVCCPLLLKTFCVFCLLYNI